MAVQKAKQAIHWDEKSIHHSESDACAVMGSREDISLLFGMKKQSDPSIVHLSNRIILNPFTARQLLSALEQVLKDHERQFGDVPQKRQPSTPASREVKASSLFQLVKKLNVSIGYEPSFKMLDKAMLADRFLLGISKRDITNQAAERIVGICERLEMPGRLLDIFKECLMDAGYIHFGFEDNHQSCVYKVYLEFWDTIKQELKKRKNVSSPCLLHLGFKWDPFQPDKTAVTRYTWFPRLAPDAISEKLKAIVDPVKQRQVFETAQDLLKISLERMPLEDLLYLEVTEEGNPRKSFDINVYKAGLLVEELYLLLTRLGQHYAIPYSEFHHLYDRIKMKRFGHLSGGVTREGADFCTVYYGVEPILTEENKPAEAMGSRFHLLTDPRHPPPARDVKQVEASDPQARRIMELVKNLEVPFGFERSFKVARKTFLPERFLVGLHTKKADAANPERILDMCRQISMPDDFLEDFQRDYASANMVLFGFEKNEKSRLIKVYLEFKDRLEKAVEDNPQNPKPFEMYTGYKWNVSHPSQKVVTQYTCYPSFVLRDMADRASRLLFGHAAGSSYRIIEGVLDLASHRAGPGEFLYLEVTEQDNIRRSFDINVYKPDLQMAEIYPWLREIAAHYAIPDQHFDDLYATARMHILGHVAGGIDRDGRDFLTLYFSEKGSMRIIA